MTVSESKSASTEATREHVTWDGRQHSYLPPAGPVEVMPLEYWHGTSELDPITFEVLRHRIYKVNEEQGMTIVKVSGSPVATFSHDFATSILSARGEAVYFGPYNQHQIGTIDHNVKWILASRADNPGIRDGDMFLGNDPWVGANHQSDVVVVCPVFVEAKVVCWIASVMHTYDVGGSTPGSFCPDARTIYDEPLPTPPTKLVEGGVVRRDVEEMFLRRSRLPELVALDLRALVASNHVARGRILELSTKYGPDAVAGIMEKVISDAERTFAARLAEIPDGDWEHRSYIESAGPDDRGVYPLAMQLRKKGERLVFSNRGTHPQVGCLNTTVGGWRSGIVAATTPILGFDLMHATGGIMRCVEFDPTPGTIFSADYPGAVSNPQFGVVAATDMAVVCISKMLAGSAHPELAHRAMAGPSSLFPVVTIAGVDRLGRQFGTLILDPMGGGLGAFKDRDGEDTGGQLWDPVSTMPNVEFVEQYFPVLYHYRRTLQDSGGAGRFRGGNAARIGFTPHKIDEIEINCSASGWAIPTAAGIFGGLPGCTNGARLVQLGGGRTKAGRLSQSAEDAGSEIVDLPAKQRSLQLKAGDLYELWWSGGGGFGDPLERDPERVSADVTGGLVSVDHARRAYGVAVDTSGVINWPVTRNLRERVKDPIPFTSGARDAGSVVCLRCGTKIADATSGDHLAHTTRYESTVEQLTPLNRDAHAFVDADVMFVTCTCPTCGVSVDAFLIDLTR